MNEPLDADLERARKVWQSSWMDGECHYVGNLSMPGPIMTIAAYGKQEWERGIKDMQDAAKLRCEKQAQYYRENELYPAYCLNGMEAGAKACGELMEQTAACLLEEKTCPSQNPGRT